MVEADDALIVVAGDILQRQARDRILIARTVDVERDRVADHHVGQRLRVSLARVDRADVLALAQHRDLVRQRHDLVQLVGDDDDGLAVGAHIAQHVEELLGLLRGEDGGGLVEDERVRAAVEDLDDLDRLLLGDGHIVDLLGRVDVEAVAVADLLDPGVGGLDVQLARLVETEDDVLRCGEHVHELVVLVDHADVVVEGVLRRADGGEHTVDIDFALVGEIDAGEHIHQRRLSAAVFTEQGKDLAPVDGQVDAVVCDDLAKALGNVSEFNCTIVVQGPVILSFEPGRRGDRRSGSGCSHLTGEGDRVSDNC